MLTRLQVRRGTASEWSSLNPVLLSGEIGLETDTQKLKVGDGVTLWNSLIYLVNASDITSFETTTQLNSRDTANRARGNHTGTQPISSINNLQTELNSKLNLSDIGVTIQGYSTILANTTASYTTSEQTKLTGIEAGAEVNVNADWGAISGDAQILNKPVLSTVATTGAYSDLSGLPILGTASATNITDYATSAQGALADTSIQPEDLSTLSIPATTLTSGTLPIERMPSLTGDITSTVGTVNTTLSANTILTKLLTVDGTGSGLDADLVDGRHLGQTGINYVPYVNNSGFLGIGNSSPVAPITVGTRLAGEPTFNGDLVINQTGATLGLNTSGGLTFKIDGTGNGYGVRLLQWFNGINAYNFSMEYRHNSATWTTGWTVTHIGNMGIGVTNPTERLEVLGNIRGTRLIATQATGTSPMTVSSTTVVTNLNADLLDGKHASNFSERVAVPATATSTGEMGQIAFDSTHFYCCTATNTWVRSPLATW